MSRDITFEDHMKSWRNLAYMFLAICAIEAAVISHYVDENEEQRHVLFIASKAMNDVRPSLGPAERESMCTAWFFGTNLIDTRKRMCGGKK